MRALSLSLLLFSTIFGCKARSPQSSVASEEAGGSGNTSTVELADWQGGRDGEVACACEGGTLVRYHATKGGVARVVLSRNADLEACVVARLKVQDSEKEQGQCRFAF